MFLIQIAPAPVVKCSRIPEEECEVRGFEVRGSKHKAGADTSYLKFITQSLSEF